ncbi:MAG: bifunctional lysylphosphatidylglycerol synthetase/lysine--tRNA ligase LysX [Mycobacteriales bacterium]
MTTDADLPEQLRVRREKRERLRAAGRDPYPVSFERTATAADLRARFADLEPGARTGEHAAVAGRVLLNRIGGKLSFATLRDGSGDIQVMLAADALGADELAAWKTDVDLGDHVGVVGEVVTTRRGELSVRASDWTLTAKALRPLPDKWHGLTDVETRVRQRYVDLIVNPEARTLVTTRSKVVTALRETMAARGFLEVETPMLHPVHGGATARPFVTHHNALDLKLYLRIAPELYLKRLIVGGVERVFEINRNFRNEGIDTRHNPEFTMLEAYETYGDYNSMADLAQELILAAADRAIGTRRVPAGDDGEVDLDGPWPKVPVLEAVAKAAGRAVSLDDVDGLRDSAAAAGVDVSTASSAGAIVLELYDHLVEPHTMRPTFYVDFPVDVSPLTRAHRSVPGVAERWDLVIAGREIGTAYSELTDPVEQRRRLEAQSAAKAAGDPEAMELDEDFLRALEYGMPPTGGLGLGVERLLMVLTNSTVRETILFPLVRPE